MGTPYNPSAVAIGTITVPADGDARNAAVFNVPMQAIADGVKFATVRNDALADLTALAAITTPANGLVRNVIGFGSYTFQTSATTGISPFRVAAADATAGGWVSGDAHQTSLIRQAPIAYRLRGITNGGSGSTPAPVAPTSAQPNFVPVGNADAVVFASSFEALRVNTGVTTNYGYLIDINADMIDGATLSSATLHFGAFGHSALPSRQPAFGIVRASVAGVFGVMANLLSTGGGLVTLAAATQPAYDAAQALVFTPNQNATIDKTAFHYSAVIFDEAGTNAGAGGLGFLGTSFQSIELAFTIPDARRS